MSYILDALRKSEQQRQLAELPSLYTAQIAADAETGYPRPLYGVLAVLLIGCGVLIGWWRPWQHGNPPAPTPTERVPVPAETRQPANTAPAFSEPSPPRKFVPLPPVREAFSSTPPLRARDDAGPHPHAPSSTPLVERPAAAPLDARALIPPAPAVQPQPIAQSPAAPAMQAPAATAETPGNTNASEAAQEQKIVSLEDLPPDIQQELPKISISGFSYSEEPRERIVGINDRLLQEGQYLVQGLKLEQIGRDGLVFSYKSYRFRKSLQ